MVCAVHRNPNQQNPVEANQKSYQEVFHLSKKFEDWLYRRIKHPENITDFDHKWIKFVANTVPRIAGTMLNFAILSAIYFWIYNKYGIERVIILMGIQMIMSIGALHRDLTK